MTPSDTNDNVHGGGKNLNPPLGAEMNVNTENSLQLLDDAIEDIISRNPLWMQELEEIVYGKK